MNINPATTALYMKIGLTRKHKKVIMEFMSPHSETVADLAIWVFAPHRRKGYGASAFALATKYAVDELKIKELHAGAYEDNIASRKIFERSGYIPNPDWTAEDGMEKHYITGEDIFQIDYIYNLKKQL